MKKITIIIMALIALGFTACKKHSAVDVQRLTLSDENIAVAGSHVTLTATFSYPSTLQSIKMVVSESSDMSNAVETNVTIDGGNLQVVVNNLWANTTYYYCLRYANKIGSADTEIKSFTTTDATLPIVETQSVSEITMTSAKVGGNVTDNGGAPITERGICYGTSHNPGINGNHMADASGANNDFTVNITGLTANTAYYARAYATNKVGTVYGDETAFVTVEGGGLPTVTTRQVTNITQTKVTGGGTVNADGGSPVTARGLCWSTAQNPTVADAHTTDGTGIGAFTRDIVGLTANTTYYVRAYATNSNGTVYGDNVRFVTQPIINDWYYYDNGDCEDAVGVYGGGRLWWGVMFPAGTYHQGKLVTKVSVYDYMEMTGIVTIYNDGTTAPETAVGSANVTLTGSADFVEIEFTEPIVIDPTKNVWVVLYNTSNTQYPAAVCDNTGDANGRWVSRDGITWTDISSYGYNYTFMIRVYIEGGAPDTVNPTWDNKTEVSVSFKMPYTDTGAFITSQGL